MRKAILVDRRDGIATVTFNRPDKRNAIDYHGWLELQAIAAELGQDRETKVVVFTGAGEHAFSAGADISDFERYRSSSEEAKVYSEAFDGAMDAIEALSKPTMSLIRGYCIGGGCELSTATDIRVAAENARLGIPVARLGMLVGYREARRLVDLVGAGNASYLLLTGRLIDAAEALRFGLVHRVLPIDEVDGHAYELARDMASLAPLSHGRHKEILRTVLGNPALEGLTPGEVHLPFANFDSEDFQEGRRAFLERRRPQFKGR